MTIPYLDKLNPQQRRAVEHGAAALAEAGPLLIIAGAGSGKTNTLVHRVAHLIVNGTDPRRIMLLTFSRRAAAEMTRRVERIVANVMRERAGVMTDAIAWTGTFHAIGARLLREYALTIGLDRSFTIHDRAQTHRRLRGLGKRRRQPQPHPPDHRRQPAARPASCGHRRQRALLGLGLDYRLTLT
jgi:superfamily I DNA/RNA helicase